MIIYNPDCDHKFIEYGIEIPIVENRAQKVFEELKKDNPSLNIFPSSEIPQFTIEDLKLAHTEEYSAKIFGSEAEIESAIINCYELIDKDGNHCRYNPQIATKKLSDLRQCILGQAALTYASSKIALKSKFSYFLGGGMHHAMSFSGRGFCLINDIVIALRKLQNDDLIHTAWVIDVDAHKGDGTAEITRKDSSIATLSIHMKSGWPLDSGTPEDPWFIPSNIDISVSEQENDHYINKLETALSFLEKNYPSPDIAIIVNGADPYEFDELESASKMKLKKEQLLERDILIYEFLKKRKIPQSYVMAGGYGTKSWEIYTQFLKFVWQSSSKGSEVSSR